MDFRITDEQQLIVETVREVMEQSCPESYMKECYEKGVYPWEFMKALQESGLSMLGVPEEFGGTPVDMVSEKKRLEAVVADMDRRIAQIERTLG